MAFFCDSLPSDTELKSQISYHLIRGLQKNHHDIHVFSTFRSTDQFSLIKNEKFKMSFPFKKWRLWELFRAVPEIIKFKPDIIHIIQSSDFKTPSFLNLQNWLPHLKPIFQNTPVVLSLYEDPRTLKSSKSISPIIEWSDLVLVPNLTFKNQVTSQLHSRKTIRVEIIPPQLHVDHLNIEESWVSDLPQKKLLIAGTLAERGQHALEFLDQLAITCHSQPDLHIIFIDGWGYIDLYQRKKWQALLDKYECAHRIFFCEQLSLPQRNLIRQKSEAIVFWGLAPTQLEFTLETNQAISENLPFVISEAQKKHILYLSDKKDLIIQPSELSQLSQTLIAKSFSQPNFCKNLNLQLPLSMDKELDDASANWVSRLYQSLLSHS